MARDLCHFFKGCAWLGMYSQVLWFFSHMPWRSYSRQQQQANSSEIILNECSWSELSSLIYDSWLDRTSQSMPFFFIGPSPFFIRPSANGPILVGQFITPSVSWEYTTPHSHWSGPRPTSVGSSDWPLCKWDVIYLVDRKYCLST